MVPATVISNSHELSGKQPRQTNGNCCVAQCKCKIDIDEMAENGESKRSINLRFDCEAENAMLNGRHEYFIVNSRQVIQVIHYGSAAGVCVCVCVWRKMEVSRFVDRQTVQNFKQRSINYLWPLRSFDASSGWIGCREATLACDYQTKGIFMIFSWIFVRFFLWGFCDENAQRPSESLSRISVQKSSTFPVSDFR